MNTSKASITQPNEIPLSKISPSPFNHRTLFKPITEQSLQELVETIKIHKVLQPILLRPVKQGYEIVVGERRFRASVLAQMETIPANIRELTDEQVQEIQLIENLQREDPHPIAEARGIATLLSLPNNKLNLKEIANRLGKSLPYVYQRIKLNDLIENLQTMTFADKLTIGQALKLARLSPEQQSEFYNNECQDWDSDEDWDLNNFEYTLRRYSLKLSNANFDINDKKLDKHVGACSTCQFNTAFNASLFPAEDAEARCTKPQCFSNKMELSARLTIASALKDNPQLPIAIYDKAIGEGIIAQSPKIFAGRTLLFEQVDFNHYENLPELPKKEDYEYSDTEEENEKEFTEAMDEYYRELAEFETKIADGTLRKVIFLDGDNAGSIALVSKREFNNRPQYNEKPQFKASDFQQAVKEKVLTSEIIESEKARLLQKEERSKELDTEKLHLSIYEATQNDERSSTFGFPFGANDKAIINFILFDSLSWSGRETYCKLAFDKKCNDVEDSEIMNFVFNATEIQLSLLIRMVMLGKSDAKFPKSRTGIMFRKLAEGTPTIDIDTLIQKQAEEVGIRNERLAEKLNVLETQLAKVPVLS